MSRRKIYCGNVLQEFDFDHMKDELNLDTCFPFRNICNERKNYIEHYNNFIYQ